MFLNIYLIYTKPPIALGAWSMALVLWQPPELYYYYTKRLKNLFVNPFVDGHFLVQYYILLWHKFVTFNFYVSHICHPCSMDSITE